MREMRRCLQPYTGYGLWQCSRGVHALAGNKWLHSLTIDNARTYSLRVDLRDWEDTAVHAEYSAFTVADNSDNYRMNYDAFVGGPARMKL